MVNIQVRSGWILKKSDRPAQVISSQVFRLKNTTCPRNSLNPTVCVFGSRERRGNWINSSPVQVVSLARNNGPRDARAFWECWWCQNCNDIPIQDARTHYHRGMATRRPRNYAPTKTPLRIPDGPRLCSLNHCPRGRDRGRHNDALDEKTVD